jgi:hypothetical protein
MGGYEMQSLARSSVSPPAAPPLLATPEATASTLDVECFKIHGCVLTEASDIRSEGSFFSSWQSNTSQHGHKTTTPPSTN